MTVMELRFRLKDCESPI
ncbi:hypothetical protein [Agathobacter rectalis]